MKAINWKCALYIILAIATITTIINWFVSDQIFGIIFIVNSIGLSVTSISIAAALFSAFFWKAIIFQNWLVKVPNLNGKWIGSIESDWIDPKTNQKIEPIHTELKIKQSLFKISCIMKTGEMRSDSISANFDIDADKQKHQLVYVYMSFPKQNIQNRSPIHYGTMIFDFDTEFNVDKMAGNYWTGRKTGGFISVTKV